MNEIICQLDENALVIVLGAHLSPAFDTMKYKILNYILHGQFSIKDVRNDYMVWIISYRKQTVQVNREIFREEVEYGVPQWSILGRIIFIM